MNTEEVMKELMKDDEFLLERMDGLGAKNMKKLKSKYVKNGDILSESNYTIPKTKDSAVIFAIKHTDSRSGKELSAMSISYYIKTYYGTYIIPQCNGILNRSICGYIEFSAHAVERIWERLGKDFRTFFKEDYIKKNHMLFKMVDYPYNGDVNESFARIGDAYIFMQNEDEGKKIVIKTAISDKELFTSQFKDKEASIRGAEAALAELGNLVSKEMCKPNGWIRSIA